VEDNLLGGSKADDEIALPVVGHPYLWALVLVLDGHGTKAGVHTVVISFDGFGVVTNDGVFSKENDHHLDILVVVLQLTNGFHSLIRRKRLIVPMRL